MSSYPPRRHWLLPPQISPDNKCFSSVRFYESIHYNRLSSPSSWLVHREVLNASFHSVKISKNLKNHNSYQAKKLEYYTTDSNSSKFLSTCKKCKPLRRCRAPDNKKLCLYSQQFYNVRIWCKFVITLSSSQECKHLRTTLLPVASWAWLPAPSILPNCLLVSFQSCFASLHVCIYSFTNSSRGPYKESVQKLFFVKGHERSIFRSVVGLFHMYDFSNVCAN